MSNSKISRFERLLEGGGFTPGSEPCRTCGATDKVRGTLIFSGASAPELCPECGRTPILRLPDNGRGCPAGRRIVREGES
jgi:hypothetical protein